MRFPVAVMAVAVVVGTALSLLIAPGVHADTPASCMFDQYLGEWSYHVGSEESTNTIDCSGYLENTREYRLHLQEPDVAVDSEGHKGFWTRIYNQGVEVTIADRKFFAFSYYETKNGNTTSFCDRTFNGWVHRVDGTHWGCFYGVKRSALAPTSTPATVLAPHQEAAIWQSEAAMVERINKRQSLWKAADYPQWHGRRVAEVRAMAGVPAGTPWPMKIQSQTLAQHHVGDLPKSIDWTNFEGRNFVSPVRNQGSCGSCYAFASMALVEARIRIASNLTNQVILSTQDPVSCSEYAQGCDGGFPYLIAGKYGEDFGLVPEECFPYESGSGNKNIPCSKRCKTPSRVYKTTDYYYVGGYFGACSEREMMVELLARGPVAVSFEVTSDFMTYKGGIYSSNTNEVGINPFGVTNHVVLVVGYGEENGVPFWKVKNSWGTEWGENGYFRIVRGKNELNIETMAVAVTPIL